MVIAVHTNRAITAAQARYAALNAISAIGAKEMVISMDIVRRALEAGRQYGKDAGHPAGLNIGDRLAYACAQSYRLQPLAKQGGLSQTDVADA